MNIQLEIGKIVGSFIAGLLVAWLASVWSFRRFRREELWKQRRDAYYAILVALGRIRESASDICDFYSSGGHLGQESWSLGDSVSRLREIVRTDDYIISAPAAEALQSVIAAFDDPAFIGRDDDAAQIIDTVQSVTPVIRKEANSQLGITR